MSSKSVKNLVPKLESFHVTPQLLLSRQKLPKHSFIWDQRDCDYYISRTIRVASCCWLLASCCLVTSLSDQDVIQGSLAGVTCLAGAGLMTTRDLIKSHMRITSCHILTKIIPNTLSPSVWPGFCFCHPIRLRGNFKSN